MHDRHQFLIDNNQKSQYSSIAKVNIENFNGTIAVYPNPITSGIIKLRFTNMKKGKYNARLLTGAAHLVLSKQLNHAGGNAVLDITPGHALAKGIYNLELSTAQEKLVLKVIIE